MFRMRKMFTQKDKLLQRGRIDDNDLSFLKGNPLYVEPAPLGGNGYINPHVTRAYYVDGLQTSIFHIKPVYYEALDGAWRPLEEITVQHGNRNIIIEKWWKTTPRYIDWLSKRCNLIGGKLEILSQIPNLFRESFTYARMGHVGLTSSEFFPDASPETTTVDGWARNKNATTWSNALDGTNGTQDASDSESGTNRPLSRKTTASDWTVSPAFYLFDTSSIADTDTIDSATFNIFSFADSPNDPDTVTQHLVAGTPASNTAIVGADFDNYGSTSFGNRLASTMTSLQYYATTLNASGLSAIDATGVSKFSMIDDLILTPTDPTGDNWKNIYMSEFTGTSRDPKLVVQHSAAGAAFTPRVLFY